MMVNRYMVPLRDIPEPKAQGLPHGLPGARCLVLGLLLARPAVSWGAGMLTPPPASVGALGLTPSGLTKVMAASTKINQTHWEDCGASPTCVNKTTPGGGVLQTVSRFLLSVCNAAGQCGGFIVSASAGMGPYSGPSGGSACPQLTTTGGNPQAGPYVSNVDGLTYNDPNSTAGSAWSIATVGFCSGNLNGFQDEPNPGALGYVRVFRRNFSYSASDCSQLSGGDFAELGTLSYPASGRMSFVQRIKQQDNCGGKIVKEVYAETAHPSGVTFTTPVLSTGTAGYGLASQDGSLLTAGLQTPPEAGMNGVLFATAAPVASAGYPLGGPPIPPQYGPARTQQNAAAVGYLTGGVTLDEGDYYWTGEGTPASKAEMVAAASTTTTQGGFSVQAVTGAVTVNGGHVSIDGVVTVQGTVGLADGVVPGSPVASVRPRGHTFAAEYARVMVKHSTAPIFGLAAKFNGLDAALSTGALQTQFCFTLVDLGSHCLDLEGSGYLTAIALMKFFVVGSAFIMGIMYLLS